MWQRTSAPVSVQGENRRRARHYVENMRCFSHLYLRSDTLRTPQQGRFDPLLTLKTGKKHLGREPDGPFEIWHFRDPNMAPPLERTHRATKMAERKLDRQLFWPGNLYVNNAII